MYSKDLKINHKAGKVNIVMLNHSKQLKAAPDRYMSIQSVNYISCSRSSYRLIGKVETYLRVRNLGSVSVFEVTINWLCLYCCHIQD